MCHSCPKQIFAACVTRFTVLEYQHLYEEAQ